MANDIFPDMHSTIAESNSLATEIFIERIAQQQTVKEGTNMLALDIAAATSTHVRRTGQFNNLVSSVEEGLSSIEARIYDLERESARTAIHDIHDFLTHFTAIAFTDSSIPVMRWAQWSSYAQCCGWFNSNNADQFGGVNPSAWGDSSAVASSMSTNPDVLRNLFNKRITCGSSCMTHKNEWYYTSSTNSMHGAVLIRVKNTTPEDIDWDVTFHYSSYGGWGELASLSLNGLNTWSSASNCPRCVQQITLSIPADRTSTVIVISGSSPGSGTRTLLQGFVDDCLVLPDGLEYADDLDVITSL
jgi:hypothetical protein